MSFLAHVQQSRAGRRGVPLEPFGTPARHDLPPLAPPSTPAATFTSPPAPAAAVVQALTNAAPYIAAAELSHVDPFAELKMQVHAELVSELGDNLLAVDPPYPPSVRHIVERAAHEGIIKADPTIDWGSRARIATEITDEVLGFGPLEPLLRDPAVSEVIVNAFDQVYVERGGHLEPARCAFRDSEHVVATVQRMIRHMGRRLDLASPMVDARLPDGSRLNAVIPPVSLHGPALTIRKFGKRLLTPDQLVSLGTVSEQAMDFLRACVRARCNILVAGGTGSGKTTLLNILSSAIPAHERIITIEDPAELRIQQRDWVSLETRPANIEGMGSITQRDLVKNALRMRPDRIIIGECRAGEAFDMLQAMNTGHDGSLSTVHANSPRDALARVQNMVLMAGLDLPLQAIREQIASGIHLVVHIARLADGSRRVTHIAEILGLQESVITMQDLFTFGATPDGVSRLTPTGLRPRIVERLTAAGELLPVAVFLP
jgi:pilus assembly protein CpaF